jgi:hypothetical protein
MLCSFAFSLKEKYKTPGGSIKRGLQLRWVKELPYNEEGWPVNIFDRDPARL